MAKTKKTKEVTSNEAQIKSLETYLDKFTKEAKEMGVSEKSIKAVSGDIGVQISGLTRAILKERAEKSKPKAKKED